MDPLKLENIFHLTYLLPATVIHHMELLFREKKYINILIHMLRINKIFFFIIKNI